MPSLSCDHLADSGGVLQRAIGFQGIVPAISKVWSRSVYCRTPAPVLFPRPGCDRPRHTPMTFFESQRALPRHVGMALRLSATIILWPSGRVGEEVINPFLLHEPAREVEIGLAVLHAVIAGLKRAHDLQVDVQARQDLFQDIRHGDVLENPALSPFGEQPELRHDIQPVGREILVVFTLRDALAECR